MVSNVTRKDRQLPRAKPSKALRGVSQKGGEQQERNILIPVKYHRLGGIYCITYPQAMPPMTVLDTSSSQMKIMYGETLFVRVQWARHWSEARIAPKPVRPREMPQITEATASSCGVGTL